MTHLRLHAAHLARLALVSLWLPACSSASFAPSVEDDAGSDTASGDGSIDTDAPDDVLDGGDISADTTAETSDGSPSETPDSCTPNACGGCEVLSKAIGEACGKCGKYVCKGTTFQCDDPGTNDCGGCDPLGGKRPGDKCEGCGGSLKCAGIDRLVCDTTSPINVCGGCSVLTKPLKEPCGVCGGGLTECDGPDAIRCADKAAGFPALGTACGTCSTSKYICATDKLSTVCSKPDDTNACKGCGTVTPSLPGTKCGVCASGSFACATPTTTTCNDPIKVNLPGQVCGICKTSKYVCASGGASTECPKPDDRISVVGPAVKADTGFTPGIVARYYENGISFLATRDGAIESFEITGLIAGYNCYANPRDLTRPLDPMCVCSPLKCEVPLASQVDGAFEATLYAGSIGDKSSALTKLISIPATGFVVDRAVTLLFKFPGTPALTKGKEYWLDLTSTSTRFAFGIGSPVDDLTLFPRMFRSDFYGSLKFETDGSAAFANARVTMRGCP